MCDNEQLYTQWYPSPVKNEYDISHSHPFLDAILIGSHEGLFKYPSTQTWLAWILNVLWFCSIDSPMISSTLLNSRGIKFFLFCLCLSLRNSKLETCFFLILPFQAFLRKSSVLEVSEFLSGLKGRSMGTGCATFSGEQEREPIMV